MKLNKTVLAVAIAGIAAAPTMASATTTLSGALQLRISGSDSDAAFTNSNGEAGFEEGEARVTAGDVLFGITSSQALNSGLTGYGSVRVDMNQLSNGGSAFTTDNVYVGVKGGFGDLRIGEVPNPGEYGQVANDLHDMGAAIDQGIGYTGSFGGATVGLSYSPAPNQDLFGVGAKFGWNGLSIGVGMQNLDEKSNISVGASFAYAGASIALHGATIEDGAGTDDETIAAVKVGYSISGIALGLTVSSAQEAEDTKIRFDASYGLGGGMSISTRINQRDNNGADSSDWRLQLAKSF